MKRILFSACDNTYTQLKTRDGLAELLRRSDFQVDSIFDVTNNNWYLYNLIIAFNKAEYQRIDTLKLGLPMIYAADMGTDAPCVCGKKIISSFVSRKRIGRKDICHQPTILVGIEYFQSLLRTIILLNTMPDYHIDVVYSGKRDISGILCAHITLHQEQEKMDALLERTDLVIGSRALALEGIMRRKPVIVLGDSGLGGVVSSTSVTNLYRNGFAGRINGKVGEYFPLDILQKEIEKGFAVSDEELKVILKRVEKESVRDREMILRIVSSLC